MIKKTPKHHYLACDIEAKRIEYTADCAVPQYEIKPNVDIRMVKLLSRAHHYFNLLTAGKDSSFKEIGILEKLLSSYVSRVAILAFLSPDIIKGILEGRHPPSLTSDSLMKSLPLPTDWAEQKKVLGFH